VIEVDVVAVVADGEPQHGTAAHVDRQSLRRLASAQHAGRGQLGADGLPDAVNDIAAARTHHIPERCNQANILLLADTGYTNITTVMAAHRPKHR
jgi:hypothetical protein